MKRPSIAIVWFFAWGLFQVFAVASVFNGTWERPEAFPEDAYNAFIYPDLVIIPLYFASAILLWRGHWLGSVLGLFCGGAVFYVMIYLMALADFQGAANLVADGVFLMVNSAAVVQIMARLRPQVP